MGKAHELIMRDMQDENNKLRAELAAERAKTYDASHHAQARLVALRECENELQGEEELVAKLRAELAAERKASSAWCDNYNIALSKAGEAARERDAIRSQLNDAGKALQDFVSYGCPACGGDCSAANPPVSLCPMQSARAVLDKIKGGGDE